MSKRDKRRKSRARNRWRDMIQKSVLEIRAMLRRDKRERYVIASDYLKQHATELRELGEL